MKNSRVWTREQLLPIARTNPEALIDIILALQEEVQLLRGQVQQLTERVQYLEARLSQNSANSSLPPSSDGYSKPAPKSLRPQSERKPGGQSGHPGNTLKMVTEPDEVIVHPLMPCSCLCGTDLSKESSLHHEKRQVFDLPPQNLMVSEHQAEVKRCPRCGLELCADFPANVSAAAQYGPRLNALLVYWRNQQLLPLERIQQMCLHLYSQNISEATIEAATRHAYDVLAPFESRACELLSQAPLAHSDETGLRVAGKLHWLHSFSNSQLTWYGVHPKRGGEAIQDFGLLSRFSGRLIHDCFAPYFTLNCAHGLCNAHLLRELIFLEEQFAQAWAAKMRLLLLAMLKFVAARKQRGLTRLYKPTMAGWISRYRKLLKEGYDSQGAAPAPTGKRGRPKQTKALNLLDRLKEHERSVLAFLYDFHVPFTNNQAEQDIRMMKVQQKISGSFRTFQGAKVFARIRSYLSTARKHQLNVFQATLDIFAAKPFLPTSTASP